MNTASIIPVRQAARKTGVPASAIRELERQGRINVARVRYGGRTFSALVDPAEVAAAARKYGVTGIKISVNVCIPENIHARIPKPRTRWILDLIRRNVPAGTEDKPRKKGQNE